MEIPGKTDSTIVNLDYLKELSKGDASFIKNMVTVFIEENPQEISQLKESIEARNYPLIYANAHRLKSSTPFIGIYTIIEKDVLEIERLAKTESGDEEIRRLFARVASVCKQARQELSGQFNIRRDGD